MTGAPSTARLLRRRNLILGALFLGNVLSYLDRVALSVAAPKLADDLHLGAAQLGLLLSMFSLGFMPGALVGGHAADRFGPKRVIGAGATAWSCLCAMTALPVGLPVLLAIRALFGVAEGPYAPSANKIIGRLFPADSYAGAFALSSAGQPVGGLVAAPIVGALIVAFGWRSAFVAVGALGVAWALAWIRFGSDKAEIPDEGAVGAVAHEGPKASLPGAILSLCRQPPVVAVVVAEFAFGYVLYLLLTWFPSYLVRELHMSMTRMSFVNSAPWLLGLVGLLLGGALSNKMTRGGWSPLAARRAILIGGLMAAAVSVFLASAAQTAVPAVLLMSAAMFFVYLTGVCYFGILQEVVVETHRGAAAGLAVLGVSAGGLVAPALTGRIVASTGHFSLAFQVAGAVVLCCAVPVMLMVRPQRNSPVATS